MGTPVVVGHTCFSPSAISACTQWAKRTSHCKTLTQAYSVTRSSRCVFVFVCSMPAQLRGHRGKDEKAHLPAPPLTSHELYGSCQTSFSWMCRGLYSKVKGSCSRLKGTTVVAVAVVAARCVGVPILHYCTCFCIHVLLVKTICVLKKGIYSTLCPVVASNTVQTRMPSEFSEKKRFCGYGLPPA